MLPDRERFRLLHGPYKASPFHLGDVLLCEARGEVVITGVSSGRIPWPMTRRKGGGAPFLIVAGDLARAVRLESEIAVAHWWGVSIQTVSAWRRALGVGIGTPGTRRLHSKWWHEGGVKETAEPVLQAHQQSPERAAKIAAAMRGKPRPRHVIEAMRKGRTGKPHTEEARKKMSESQKARGAYPPAAGRPFTAEEDALLGTMSDMEVAAKIGRDLKTVARRRARLGIASYRRQTRGW